MSITTSAASTEQLMALLEPVTVAIDHGALRVLISDRGERVGYELWFRPSPGQAGGPGWLEFCRDPHGRLVRKSVRAGEVMALVRDAGREREVAEMTLQLAEWFRVAGCAEARRLVRRLEDEVAEGMALERIALRALQARLVERLVEGETLSEICRRGGFLDRRRRPDTTWFERRRAGLAWTLCNKTGKWRIARTATPEVLGRMARAICVAPHEVGA